MQPGDSGGGEREIGMDDGDKTEGECSLGTVVEENGGMDTESAAWGQWWGRTEGKTGWKRTEVWMIDRG